MSGFPTSFDTELRTALPESVRHSLLLQEEIAKMSVERSESKESSQGGSLERWQGPYWWNSLKNSKTPSGLRR